MNQETNQLPAEEITVRKHDTLPRRLLRYTASAAVLLGFVVIPPRGCSSGGSSSDNLTNEQIQASITAVEPTLNTIRQRLTDNRATADVYYEEIQKQNATIEAIRTRMAEIKGTLVSLTKTPQPPGYQP